MPKLSISAFLALSLLPLPALAQAGPQTAAAVESSASASPPASSVPGITREQFIHRAEERAGRRAAGQFDGMDTNHDGVLDAAEMHAWRSQHARRVQPQPDQPRPQ